MGNALAERVEGQAGSDGRSRSLVRADRRSEHGASSMAVCEPGGEEGEEGDELGRRGVGRYGAQDGAANPDDEEPGAGSDAVESGRLNELDVGRGF